MKLSQAVHELNEEILPDGERKTFSIKFVKKNGELIFFKRAIKTGLRMDMKKNAVRGICPVDENGSILDHVFPVSIFSIVEFNGEEVVL